MTTRLNQDPNLAEIWLYENDTWTCTITELDAVWPDGTECVCVFTTPAGVEVELRGAVIPSTGTVSWKVAPDGHATIPDRSTFEIIRTLGDATGFPEVWFRGQVFRVTQEGRMDND